MDESDSIKNIESQQVVAIQQRHLIIGWLGLLFFLSLGIVLEMLHGLKVGFYLDVQNSSRRLMWTLAHTHGTLFALIHITFAHSLGLLRNTFTGSLRLISRCLTGALVVMPLGFFTGGFWTYGGDPGLGVFLVPVGALLLFSGVAMFCMRLLSDRKAEGKQATTDQRKNGDQQKTGKKQSSKSARKRRRK